MTKKSIHKPKPVSGFPEWLPEVQIIQQQWMDHIRKVFESYGYGPIETPSVETLDTLQAKGEDVDKEIYVLERLHKEDGDKEARLALHFDQTVPLARYTAQHFNDLIFPFKRYQMQRVWRGERPQAGRFREFYQCDIDVIHADHLPLHFDAEMPSIIWEVLSSLPGMAHENIQIRISNRKILIGLLKALSVEAIVETTRVIDKLEKIGEPRTREILAEDLNLPEQTIQHIFSLCTIKTTNGQELLDRIGTLDIDPEKLLECMNGAEELAFVLDQLKHLPEHAVIADLSIVRGLDYYTGTVYETVFTDNPTYGSICSGGRYDDLASQYIHKKLPGVGISIGFSRLFDYVRQKGLFDTQRRSPADILVVMPSEEQRQNVMDTASALRNRGYNVETAHGGKLKRQLAYAEKKGIPYVWFPPFEDGDAHEVKDMRLGEQKKVTLNSWTSSKG